MVWERQVFGAICFAVYEATFETVTFKDIALDFFGTKNGDVVSSADQTWLDGLLHGCNAKLFIANVPPALKYDAKRQVQPAISRCRFRGCQSIDNIRY